MAIIIVFFMIIIISSFGLKGCRSIASLGGDPPLEWNTFCIRKPIYS